MDLNFTKREDCNLLMSNCNRLRFFSSGARRSARVFFASIFFVMLSLVSVQAQNTLDNAGLSVNTGTGGAAYSLRKLSSSYSGNAVRVRRSNDNTTADIGFTAGGFLDTAALKTFVGANTGTVTIWYDQSGNGKDAVQASANFQPRIVNLGALFYYNQLPSVYYFGFSAQDIYLSTPLLTHGSGTLVGSSTALDQFASYVLLVPTASETNTAFPYILGNQYFSNIYMNLGTYGGFGNSTTNGSNGKMNVIGGTQATPASIQTKVARIGGFFSNAVGAHPLVGYVSEYIVFQTAVSTANLIALERNEGAYFAAPPLTSATSLSTCSGQAISYTATTTAERTPDILGFSWSRAVVAGISNTAGSATSVSIAPITETLINTTSSPVAVAYTVSLSVTQGIFSKTLTVTVNPAAAVSPQTLGASCSVNSFSFTPTGTIPTGTTYSWNAPATITGNFAGGVSGSNQTSIVGTLSNLGVTSATALYSITATTGSCATTFTSTVVIDAPFTVSPQTLGATCSGSAFVFTPVGTIPANTVYSWAMPAVNSGSFTGGQSKTNQPNINGLLVDPVITAASALYTITATSGACNSVFAGTVGINPVENISVQVLTPVCSGAGFVSAPVSQLSNTQYSWSAPIALTGAFTNGQAQSGQLNIFGTLNNLNATAATALYTITATTSLGCSSTFTNTIQINPNAAITAVVITPTCGGSGFSYTPIAGIVPAGTTYSWGAPSTVSGSFIGGVGQSSQSAVFGALTNTGSVSAVALYTVTATNAGCSSSFTSTVTVYPDIDNNTFSSTTPAIGFGVTPATIIGSTPTGGSGTYAYNWRVSTDGINFSQASAPLTLINYSPGALTQSLWYKRQVISSTCINFPVGSLKITVYPVLTVGLQPTVSQSICNNTTVGITTAGAGGSLTYTYQWYSNTTNSNIAGSLITSATSATYTVPATTVANNRYYYAVITDSVTGVTVTSNAATVTTRSALTVAAQPAVTQTVINNSAATITTLGTGGTLVYSYQWYSNTVNSNTGGTLIASATSASYIVPATTTSGTRYFYGIISDAVCVSPVTTTVAAVITTSALTISTQPVVTQTICNNTSTGISVAVAGGSGSYSYQWYSNTTNSNVGGSVIGGATNASYTDPGTTTAGNRYFYAIITDVTLTNSITSNPSRIITLSGTPVSVNLQPTANTALCVNGSFSLQTGATGGSSGTYVYQWYSNTTASNTGGTLISGETAVTLSKQLTTAGNYYYYATMGDPVCGSSIPSNVATLRVNALPTVTLSANTQTVCQNIAAAAVTATVLNGAGSATYQWYRSTTDSNAGGTNLGSANGAQTAAYTPVTTTTSATYYYVVSALAGNGCGTASSATHQAIVNYVAQPSDIVVTPHNVVLCSGLPATLHASLSNSSTITNPVFTWYSNANLTTLAYNSADVTTPVLNATTVFYLKVSGSNVCPNITGNGYVETVNITAAAHAPVLVLPSNLAVCAGLSVTQIAFSSSESNTTYTWSNDNTGTGLASAGAGDIASFTGINSTLADNIAQISVSPFANGCAGLSRSFTITIKPVFTVADAALSVCSGSSINYTATNVPAGTKYTWTTVTVPSGVTGASGNGIFQNAFSQTLVNTTNAPLQVVYSVTPEGCSTRPFLLTVTVNPVPQISNQTLAGAICSGAAFSFTPSTGNIPSGALYVWNVPTATPSGSITGGTAQSIKNPAISDAILVNSLPAVSNAVYVVTPYGPASMGSCVGATFTVTVPVNPKPLLSISSVPAICNKGVATFIPASATTGVGYTWQRDAINNISTAVASGTNGFSEILTNTATFPVLVTYNYTLTANGCSNDQTVQVIVNPDPVLSSATQVNICSGSVFNYNPSSLTTGATFTWSRAVVTGIRNAANAGSNDVFEALVNTTNAPVVVTYRYTLSANGCQYIQDVLVTVNPIPTMLDIPDQSVCNGADVLVNFSGSVIPGTTYNWTNNNSSIGLGSSGQGNLQFTSVNQQSLIQSGVITVLPTANGCSGTGKNFSVAVNPTPELSSSLTPPSVCSNTIFNYVPKSNTPATVFSWTRAAEAGIDKIAGSGNGQINETLRNISNGSIAVTYVYTLTANGCTSKRNVIVIVTPIPTVNNPGDQVICNNSLSIVNFTGSIVNNTTYGWTNNNASLGLAASGSGDLFFNAVNAGTTPIQGTIKITPEANGCKGLSESFNVTINPTLALKSSISPAAICSNSNFYYVPVVSDTSSLMNISWSRPAVYGLSNKPSFGSKEINDTLINSTGSPILVTYIFTLKNNYCSNTQNVVVQVNPSITISNVQSGISVCSGDAFIFSPASGATGIQYKWTRDTATGVSNIATSGTGNINETLVNTTDLPIDVIYKYSLSIGTTCNSEQLLRVTVKPSPKLTSATNVVSCSNSLFSYVPLSNLAGTSFTWTRAIATGISNSASYGFGSITEGLVNTKGTQSNVTYGIELANVNGCNSKHDISVGVNPLPTAIFAADQSVCAGSTTKLLHFTGVLAGTSFAWTNSEPAIGLAASGTNDIAAFVTQNAMGATLVATIQVTPSLNGCNGSTITVARISVNQPVTSNFIESYPAVACPNQIIGPLVSSVPLGGDGLNFNFQWQLSTDGVVYTNVTGTTSASRKAVAPAQAKDSWYRMVITSGGCVSESAPVKVLIAPKPVITITNHDNYLISKGNATQVFASGAVSYQWTPRIYVNDPAIANPFLNPIADTRYTVTGINAEGCSDTTSVLIRVIDGYSIAPNNVLTPNGDGFNDTWKIKNIEFYKENSVTIYNSNSVKVFEKQNYVGDWNGTTTGGAKLASGVYYFVIKLKQGDVIVKGDLTLLN